MTPPRSRSRALPIRLAFTASVALAVALIAPGAAAASNTITCGGGIKLAEQDQPRTSDLAYQFRCDEPITGFAIALNRQVGGFEPAVLVTTGSSGTPADGEAFGCEGRIPGFGFACSGEASARNLVLGEFATSTAACPKRGGGALLPMLMVVDSEGRISEPYPLKAPKCPKPKRKNRAGSNGPGRS